MMLCWFWCWIRWLLFCGLIVGELTVLGKIGSFMKLFCICSFGRAGIGLRAVG